MSAESEENFQHQSSTEKLDFFRGSVRVAAKNPLVNNRNLAPNRCKRKATHVPLGRGVSVGIQFLLLIKDSGCIHTYSI